MFLVGDPYKPSGNATVTGRGDNPIYVPCSKNSFFVFLRGWETLVFLGGQGVVVYRNT